MLQRYNEFLPEEPRISVKEENGCYIFESPVYVWKVCLDFEDQESCDDNMFDLIPGVPKRVRCAERPEVRTLSGVYRALAEKAGAGK